MAGLQEAFLHFIYGVPFPLLGALAGGEETIIAVCILSVTTGAVSFPTVVLWSFIGTTIKDSCVFLFGRHFIKYLETKETIRTKIHTMGAFVNRVTHKNYFLTLLVTKFLYGMRVITIFYMGRERMAFPRFLSYNVPVTALWIVVTCTIGWFAGRGLVSVTRVFGDVVYGFSILIFAAIALYALQIWLNKKIVEDENRS